MQEIYLLPLQLNVNSFFYPRAPAPFMCPKLCLLSRRGRRLNRCGPYLKGTWGNVSQWKHRPFPMLILIIFCGCYKPACTWKAKAMSSAHAPSLAPIWGTSFVCGSDMSWRCLQRLLASLCDQDAVSTPFLCALPGRTSGPVHSRGVCQQGCNGFIVRVALG